MWRCLNSCWRESPTGESVTGRCQTMTRDKEAWSATSCPSHPRRGIRHMMNTIWISSPSRAVLAETMWSRDTPSPDCPNVATHNCFWFKSPNWGVVCHAVIDNWYIMYQQRRNYKKCNEEMIPIALRKMFESRNQGNRSVNRYKCIYHKKQIFRKTAWAKKIRTLKTKIYQLGTSSLMSGWILLLCEHRSIAIDNLNHKSWTLSNLWHLKRPLGAQWEYNVQASVEFNARSWRLNILLDQNKTKSAPNRIQYC